MTCDRAKTVPRACQCLANDNANVLRVLAERTARLRHMTCASRSTGATRDTLLHASTAMLELRTVTVSLVSEETGAKTWMLHF